MIKIGENDDKIWIKGHGHGPIEVGGGFFSSSSSISVGFIMFANSICSLLKKKEKKMNAHSKKRLH